MKLSELLKFLQPSCSVRLRLIQMQDNKETLVTDIGKYFFKGNIPKLFLNLEVKKESISPYRFDDITYISIDLLYEEK